MALSLEAFAAAGDRRTVGCGVSKVLRKLDPEDRQVLEDALADPSISHAAIYRVGMAEGLHLPELMVGRHRAGKCSCGR